MQGLALGLRLEKKTSRNYPPVVICASCIGLTWIRSQYHPVKTLKSAEFRHHMRALIIHQPQLQQEERRTFPVGYMTNTETSFLPLKPYIAALPVSPLVAQTTAKCSRSLPDFPSFLLTRKNSNRFLFKSLESVRFRTQRITWKLDNRLYRAYTLRTAVPAAIGVRIKGCSAVRVLVRCL